MAFRTGIPDFQLANAIYTAAQVTFYTIDQNGEKTATLATLYAEPTGAQTASNPQNLDSEGKFQAPVYIEEPVIAEVVGPNVGSHSTGIIGARGKWRGDWATATLYHTNDTIVDPVSGDIYAATNDYVSGASVTVDEAAGNLEKIIDQTALISGGAAKAIKVPVDVATTGETLALSGLPVIDGRQTVAGDRVLDKDNADPTKRGIYNAAAGAWTRAVDCDASAKFGNGMIVYVINGTENHNRAFQATIADDFELGADAVTWAAADLPNSAIEVQFGSPPDGQLQAGAAAFHYVPFDCTITMSRLMANRVGSVVIDVQKATFPSVPDSGDSICASAKPTLTGAQTAQDATLTGWTKALKKDDVLRFVLDSVSGLQFVKLVLPVTRN
jgi:hypothetical protein